MNTRYKSLKLGFTSSYLIPSQDGYWMVDTSYPEEFPHILSGLKRLGSGLEKIRGLFLTHHHDDHAGCLAEMANQASFQVIAHQDAADLLPCGQNEPIIHPYNRRVRLVVGLFFALLRRTGTYPPFRLRAQDRTVREDELDSLAFSGVTGSILCTPGHSHDSLSLLLSDGSAFVGDVAMNFLAFTGIRNRPIFIEDEAQVYQSWQKLLARGAQMIYPAHGRPFPAEALRRRLAEVKA